MRVLVYEDNLIWSSRLIKGLKALGHEAILKTGPDVDSGEVAIVNLASPALDPSTLVRALTEQGVRVIGHAGHKEKDLLALGKEAGCQRLASNGELTFKLEAILNEVGY